MPAFSCQIHGQPGQMEFQWRRLGISHRDGQFQARHRPPDAHGAIHPEKVTVLQQVSGLDLRQVRITNPDKRREAWGRAFSGRAGWVGAAPNEGHYALVRLLEAGKLSSVITQNVDNLHQDSGIPAGRVIELHGNASYATCLDCGTRHELADLKARFVETDELPVCQACGGIVKTATISFGQQLKPQVLRKAELEALNSDLFLVLGSSLVVYPAAALPQIAKRNGAALAILNREPTDIDGMADLVLNDEIGPVMSEVAANL